MPSFTHFLETDPWSFDLKPKESKATHLNVAFPGTLYLEPGGTVVLPGGGGGPGGGPHRPSTSAQNTHPAPTPKVAFKLYDPDNRLVHDSSTGTPCVITMDDLNRVRDLAGYIRQPWTVSVTNTWHYPYKSLTPNAVLVETIASSSAAPLIDNAPVTLSPGVPYSIPFRFNRLGNIQVGVSAEPASAIVAVDVLDSSGNVLASGYTNTFCKIGLRELHNGQRKGLDWSIRLQSGSSCVCHVSAEVYDAVTIPAELLEKYFDLIFGLSGTNLTLSVEYDSQADESFVCLSINKLEVQELFDTIGVLSDLEKTDAALRGLAPPFQPPPPACGTPFRMISLGSLQAESHRIYLKNCKTSSIRITIEADDDNISALLNVSVAFASNVSVDIAGEPDLDLHHLSITVDLVPSPSWVSQTQRVTLKPQVPPTGLLHYEYNWNDVPDGVVHLFKDADALIQGKADQAISKFGDYLVTFMDKLFYQFQGAVFDFIQSPTQWQNRNFIFNFVAGEEDPPGALDPHFYPGAPDETTSVMAGARATAAAAPDPWRPPLNWHSPNLAKIDHIVVLMKENRSFDHVFGYLSLTGARTDVDGLTDAVINVTGPGTRPRPYPLVPDLPLDFFPFDPDHDYEPVALQIDNPPDGPPMHGFIGQFVKQYPFLCLSDKDRRARGVDPDMLPFEPDAVMGYHTSATVPYYDVLAKHYTVCDRWFSSHPGPTFPNRFFSLGGKLSKTRGGEPNRNNDIADLAFLRTRTIFDELTAREISWTQFESSPDVTMLRMYARYAFDTTHIRDISEFFTQANAGNLPSVSFVDPNFHYGTTNDDHPPTSISAGQQLVQRVVEALQANRAAWEKTLLIITYDEHGSIFDHVVPPTACTYIGGAGPQRIPIRYGVRVPTLLISPWVEAGCVHTVFDHCSILKSIIARFCPDDPPILSDRVAFATDLGSALSRTSLPPVNHPLNHEAPALANAAAIGGDSEPVTARNAAAAAPAAAPAAPLPRFWTLMGPRADWHDFMARLKQLTKP